MIHTTRTMNVYGIISEMIVPRPAVHVLLRDDDDERQVDHQRGDDVQRRIADAVRGQHRLRGDTQPHEERHEDRREERPFRQRAGMMMSISAMTRISRRARPSRARGPLQHVGELAAITRAC